MRRDNKFAIGYTLLGLGLLVALIILLLASTAHAGVVGSIKGWISANALTGALAAIFALIATFAGGTAVGKILLRAKLPIYELKDIAVRIHAARRPSSPGGRNITTQEKDAILAEVDQLIIAIITALGGKPA